MNDKVRVLLVDDHAMLRKGMVALLGEEADIEVIGEAGDGEQAIAQARELNPDVVVMDINMPRLNGIEATRQIVAESPASKVIALSINSGKRFVDDMLSAGAVGYLLKESVPEELLLGIRAVMRGDMYLSSATTSTVVSAYVEGMSSEQAEVVNISILQTKLHRPAAPAGLATRTRLFEQLDAGRERPLTLVSAPAGYGKSVLISDWLEISDWPSAWLSLDKGDSDLRQFLSYFLAAVNSAFPEACKQTRSVLAAPQLPSVQSLVQTLTNELDLIEQPFMLVLDDFHRIDAESPVNELLQLLLDHPPIPLHLAILTRHDPPLQLLTLRVHDQITELRMQDLSFTLQESRQLLEKGAGFTATDEAMTNLHKEMEGWAVGLQLVSLTLQLIKDPNEFLCNLHGGLQQTQQYLTQEVLARQPPWMQDWLMKTAILDRFCAPLCVAVCGPEIANDKPAVAGDKFMKEVFYRNLFAIPLDIRGDWFRYHHLFQSLLQGELEQHMSAGEIAGLYLRASEWHEGQDLIEEAIRYAMKANDGVGAADIVERHLQVELSQDRWYIVERWFAMLPLEIIQQRPRLLLAQVWGLYHQYRMLEIPPVLEQVESLLVDQAADETLLGEINFYRGFILTMFQGDAEGALILFKEARKQLPRLQAPTIVGQLEILDAIVHQMVGEGARAIQSLNQRIHAMGLREDKILPRMVSGKVFIHLLSADLVAAIPVAQYFTSINSEGWSRYLRANADLQSYHLDKALQGFQYAVEKRDILHRKAAVEAQVGLVLTYQALQRSDDTADAMKQLMQFALDTGAPEHIAVALSCQARLSLLQDDPKPAIDWARSINAEAHAPSMLMWLEIPVITKLRVMVATGSHESLQQAVESLARLRQSTEAVHNTYQLIEILALQSVALEKLGRADEALEVLQQVIALAEPGGWVYTFVELGQPMTKLLQRYAEQNEPTDYVRRVLDQCSKSAIQGAGSAAGKSLTIADSEVSILGELTNRERDVLELLAQRLQNKEIATKLFVSPETIKSYLKRIYQKLDVHNRRDAAKMAEKLLR